MRNKRPRERRAHVIHHVYRVCEGWHSGQSSRGYRLLCRCRRWLTRYHSGDWWLQAMNEERYSPALLRTIEERYANVL